ARAPTEPTRPRQLACQHLHLLAQTGRPPDVVEPLGLLELAAQLAEPRPVCAAALGVEHLAGVPRADTVGSPEIERVKLEARMREQLEEVGDALHVLEPRELALASDGPDAALVTEARGAAPGYRKRRRWDRGARSRSFICREQLLQRDEPESSRGHGRLRC